MTFGQAATLHVRRINENVGLKRRTRLYWKVLLAALFKTWPELAETEIRRITPSACRTWAARYSKTASPSRYNNGLALLRHVVDLAIESGVVYSNPAADLDRKP